MIPWRLPLYDYDRHLENGHVTLSSTSSTGFGGHYRSAVRVFAGNESNWAHIDVMAQPAAGQGDQVVARQWATGTFWLYRTACNRKQRQNQ